MKSIRTASRPALVLASAVAAVGLLSACAGNEATDQGEAPAAEEQTAESGAEQTPSEVLASTPWETTGATDQDGEEVPLDDEDVSTFVGWAYFHEDGTFNMYELSDEPKMQGDWTVSEDGSTRTIVARDETGEELFTRDSRITVLTDEEFTYRVFPDEGSEDEYYDIIHTPTDHAEPAS